MGKTNKLFREESIIKLLIRFSVPILLSYLISELYGMVDSLYVGNYVGDNAIASLSLVFPIQKIVIALGIMVGMGAATSISRKNGNNDIDGMKRYLVNGFYFVITLTALVAGLIALAGDEVLMATGATKELLGGSLEYLNIIIIGFIFLNATTYISSVLLTFGNNKVSLTANLLGAVINTVLDYVLIVNFKMGITGAAIATVVSQGIGFLYAFYNMMKFAKENSISFKPELKKAYVVGILGVGVSAFVVESVDGIVTAAINNMVSGIGGEQAIAILGISLKLYMFLFLANFAVAAAMQPVASYSYGSKNYKRLRDVVSTGTTLSFVVSLLSWAPFMVFTPNLVGMFTDNQALIVETSRVFRIMILAIPVSSVYYIAIFYLQSVGRVKMSLFMSIFRHIIVMLPISFILMNVFDMGLLGIWISYPISDLVAGAVSAYLLREEKAGMKGLQKQGTNLQAA